MLLRLIHTLRLLVTTLILIDKVRCFSTSLKKQCTRIHFAVSSSSPLVEDFVSVDDDAGESDLMVPTKTFKDKWARRFEEYKGFVSEYGHNTPDYRSEDPFERSVGMWVKNQRTGYRHFNSGKKYTTMTQKRIDMLEQVGFQWSVFGKRWHTRFEEVKSFKDNHGHFDIPRNCAYKEMKNWISLQRLNYKRLKQGKETQGRLSKQQIEKLESIGFPWAPCDDTWNQRYEELLKFRNEHGHTYVPQKCKKHPELGVWVRHQRRACKDYVLSVIIEGKVTGVHVSGLDVERIGKLREVDFCWLPDPDSPFTAPPKGVLKDWYRSDARQQRK